MPLNFRKILNIAIPIASSMYMPRMNPVSTGIAVGLTTAAASILTGGNRHDALRGGLMTGAGAGIGNKLGEENRLARYFGGSETFKAATTAIGAGLGAYANEKYKEAYNLRKNIMQTAQGSTVLESPEELRQQIAEQTGQAFEKAQIPKMLFQEGRKFSDPAKYVGLHNRSIALNAKAMVKQKRRDEMARRTFLLNGRTAG